MINLLIHSCTFYCLHPPFHFSCSTKQSSYIRTPSLPRVQSGSEWKCIIRGGNKWEKPSQLGAQQGQDEIVCNYSGQRVLGAMWRVVCSYLRAHLSRWMKSWAFVVLFKDCTGSADLAWKKERQQASLYGKTYVSFIILHTSWSLFSTAAFFRRRFFLNTLSRHTLLSNMLRTKCHDFYTSDQLGITYHFINM